MPGTRPGGGRRPLIPLSLLNSLITWRRHPGRQENQHHQQHLEDQEESGAPRPKSSLLSSAGLRIKAYALDGTPAPRPYGKGRLGIDRVTDDADLAEFDTLDRGEATPAVVLGAEPVVAVRKLLLAY